VDFTFNITDLESLSRFNEFYNVMLVDRIPRISLLKTFFIRYYKRYYLVSWETKYLLWIVSFNIYYIYYLISITWYLWKYQVVFSLFTLWKHLCLIGCLNDLEINWWILKSKWRELVLSMNLFDCEKKTGTILNILKVCYYFSTEGIQLRARGHVLRALWTCLCLALKNSLTLWPAC